MFSPFRGRFESWTAIRARMLRETEVFIEEGLRHPERQVRIPALKVGSGTFTRIFAQAFWAQVLGTS
ncbi:MAG TPA: hypothetical protein PLL20_06275 [Phycisphaerae bacterium]|mgnify:CR=1 FL=1|nr:hypothetical protein [Phycisphaerae bacterium]HRR84664.1 hypothetical protein [Phycisphaerae bacterium]